jgi:glucosamine--fructose-6-phosphate aminotransferase (isomerizing)
MCGIVGYVGSKQVVPLILEGLRRLEYRGYDSAGIAVAGNGHGLQVRRAAGKLRNLEDVVRHDSTVDGTYGIGHTRWATHGHPTEINAHPHRDCSGTIVVVHNGIIENYAALKSRLVGEGHAFASDTDSEVIAHLIEHHYFLHAPTMRLEEAVRLTVRELAGVFALSVMLSTEKDKIVVARNGPPVVLGIGDHEYFVASDIPAILDHTREVLFLGDGDLAVLTPDGFTITDFDGVAVDRKPQHVEWDASVIEKAGFAHFMLKEIYEQPAAVRDTMLSRVSETDVDFGPMDITADEFRRMPKLHIAACGTSWHAATAGKYMIEKLARVPVEVDYASEFRYRDPLTAEGEMALLISQSGETADTLAAQRAAKARHLKTLAICNVVGSMITREAHGTIYTNAGPEIGVASTKAFTGQLTALYQLAVFLGRVRGTIDDEQARTLLGELRQIPKKAAAALECDDLCRRIAGIHIRAQAALYLGRGIHYPIALEGALKLKEISYIHAQAFPAGEMKHGPNALIDRDLPVLVVATRDERDEQSMLLYGKTRSNIQEVSARSGRVIAIATEGDTDIAHDVEQVIYVPQTTDLLAPIIEVIPMQLLAYAMAVHRGCDVDQPRNLAKSVTVE